ncbi:unnamed protein product [Nippostrongylus brasiliensis]|uniref:Transmembrane protein n=1 Tax=Nippostrongylus brasiliensis TaxID=27835 RepID=A0A0N4Y4Q1_NIPBR|nr:unnamed protein product [Nippostrongylus brasiliensis]
MKGVKERAIQFRSWPERVLFQNPKKTEPKTSWQSLAVCPLTTPVQALLWILYFVILFGNPVEMLLVRSVVVVIVVAVVIVVGVGVVVAIVVVIPEAFLVGVVEDLTVYVPS